MLINLESGFGKYFIPDAQVLDSTIGKISIEISKENPVDVLFTNGPPHSTHMIAYGVKNNLEFHSMLTFKTVDTGRLFSTTYAQSNFKKSIRQWNNAYSVLPIKLRFVVIPGRAISNQSGA